MAPKVKIGGDPIVPQAQNQPVDETFTYLLPDGSPVVVGKPRGVLKLKLRDLLTDEQFKDQEIKEIAKAFLSIRNVAGVSPAMRTPEHFEAMLNRFASDEDIDSFMNEWQKLTNPVVHGIVSAAIEEAIEKGLNGDQLDAYITERVMEETRRTMEKVKA